jgi:predicted nuclease with TOPRIM domain
MLGELDSLEAKIAQLLERHQAMRAENMRLRQQVVALENSNKVLNDRIDEARGRMEALYDKIPD